MHMSALLYLTHGTHIWICATAGVADLLVADGICKIISPFIPDFSFPVHPSFLFLEIPEQLEVESASLLRETGA